MIARKSILFIATGIFVLSCFASYSQKDTSKSIYNKNALFIQANKEYIYYGDPFYDDSNIALYFKHSFGICKSTLINIAIGFGNYSKHGDNSFIVPAKLSCTVNRFEFGFYTYYSRYIHLKEYRAYMKKNRILAEVNFHLFRFKSRRNNNFNYIGISVTPMYPCIGINFGKSFNF